MKFYFVHKEEELHWCFVHTPYFFLFIFGNFKRKDNSWIWTSELSPVLNQCFPKAEKINVFLSTASKSEDSVTNRHMTFKKCYGEYVFQVITFDIINIARSHFKRCKTVWIPLSFIYVTVFLSSFENCHLHAI